MLSPVVGGRGIMYSGRLSVVRPSTPTCLTRSLLGRGLSMKLATDIHHVSGNCRKGLRSEVKGQDELTYNGGGIHLDGAASMLACFHEKKKIFDGWLCTPAG